MSRCGRVSSAFASSRAASRASQSSPISPRQVDVPAVRGEATADVVGVRQLGAAVDRDPVVVVHADQAAEPEVAGERRRFVADALHEAAVAGDDVGVVIDELAAEAFAQHALGDGHADGVAEALAEWPGGDLDARGVAGLGVARGARVVGAERLDVGELQAVAGQVEHRVLEDRGVAVGQDEAVPIGPLGVVRVVLEDAAVEDVGERGERHRRALVAALGPQRRVHGETTDDVDRLGLDVGREGGRHRGRPYPTLRSRQYRDVGQPVLRERRVTGRRQAGGSRVNGTIVHGPRSTRQCAKTWP